MQRSSLLRNLLAALLLAAPATAPARAHDPAEVLARIGTPPDWTTTAPLVAEAFRLAEDRNFSDATDANSTLTRDLIRMLALPGAKPLGRDWQLVAAVGQALPARTILNAYLDRIFLGRRCFGIAAGAQVWFGLPPEALDARQAAFLAALARDPQSPARRPDSLHERTDWVLAQMDKADLLTPADRDRFAAGPLAVPPGGRDCPPVAPG